MIPQRHHLIYLMPHADFLLASFHDEKQTVEQQVFAWLSKGMPCIYAQQITNDTMVRLGVSLWYANAKHRVGLHVAPSAIYSQKPLPQLLEMQDFFLHSFGIKDVSRIIEPYPISDIGVYGSFLSQYVSGYDFVTQRSDLDLLIHYHGGSLDQLQGLIDDLTKQFKRTIDGEVRFQQLGDIPIKELLNRSAKQLLCKAKDKVTLVPRMELYEYYPLL